MDLEALTIRGVEPMNRSFVLEGRIGALKSPLSSNNTHIGELESQLASKSLEFDTATAELESTQCRLRLTEDAASLMQEQVQN